MITVTDLFCGAGGMTTGITQAGAETTLAINHSKRAIETHNTNYPNTQHVLTDLHNTNPKRYRKTQGLAASPECTNHSIAKGQIRRGQGQPVLPEFSMITEEIQSLRDLEERSRCTMWTPLDWAECHGYDFVLLENVVDAYLWAPFQAWLHAWTCLGYEYELVYLNSMYAHPTPQSRDRMYFVAWKRGMRRPNLKITPKAYCCTCDKNVASVQSWKNPQKRYGKYKQQYVYRCPQCAIEVIPYYYAAANAIDWGIPAPRIGDRKKQLQKKTMERISDGLEKFSRGKTPEKHAPFLFNLNHADGRPINCYTEPFSTQTTYDSRALAVPPFILDHLGEYRLRAITDPLSTMCAGGNHQSVIMPKGTYNWLMTYYNHGQLCPIEEVAPTITTLARHALVTSEKAPEEMDFLGINECGFRMLIPKEIQAAMAFPEDYIITGTRREQIKQLGNACTPPTIKHLLDRLLPCL